MGESYPRETKPLHSGIYRGKSVCIYRIGDRDSIENTGRSTKSMLNDLYDNAWCGFVRTQLDTDRDDIGDQLEVYGGITYAQDDWIGFDTLNTVDDGPETLGEMRAEVETLADQTIVLEFEKGLLDDDHPTRTPSFDR